MVKRWFCVFTIVLLAYIYLSSINLANSETSNKSVVIEDASENIGEKIATKGGWKLIEFWHYSGGYWKATTVTDSGKKELIINDRETAKLRWTNTDFLKKKIYENEFVLEYKIYHPQEVINAIKKGATITPVISVDKQTVFCPEDMEISITDLFNYSELPKELPAHLPEKPEFIINSEYLIIRALPQLNCDKKTYNQLVMFYPHKIPIVTTSFGSLSYAMYHHNGSDAGVSYSPDPAYSGQGIKSIEYKKIKDLEGQLQPGDMITINSHPLKDEPSEDLRIGYDTFVDAGAISIRFWYPIRVDYYAKYEDTVTLTPTPSPTPTPTPFPTVIPVITENSAPQSASDLDPNSVCIIRADDRGKEKFDVDKGIPVRENLYVNIRTKEYLAENTFTEHTHTESLPIRVKQTYRLTWREDRGHYDTNSCGSGILKHVKGTYCTDFDGDGINDSCPGHPYYGCQDTDGDGVKDYCPGHETWIPDLVDQSETQVVYSDAHAVTRSYSYWTVDHLEVFAAESATVFNEALPGGKTTLQASNLQKPVINLSRKPNQTEHVLNDPYEEAKNLNAIRYDATAGCYVVDLGEKTLDGGSSRPTPPAITNYISLAENAIGQYRVRNDSLSFNGVVILDDTIATNGNTADPQNIPESAVCGENTFFKNQLKIPDATLNGKHDTTATVTYRRLSQAVSPVHGETMTLPVASGNSVMVHTPVVCNSGVRDDYANDQSLNPDRSRSALVLGRPSRIRFLTTGEHLNIPGYATSGTMDCRKYTRERQVRFPFDVYIGTDEPVNDCFVPKNTWYSVPMSVAFDEMDIFIPTWVPEGDYEVQFREIAVNAPDLNRTEELANRNHENYVAVRTSPVRVIGRIYGLKITDVNDELWRPVFRVNENSSQHTGNYYYTGTKDEEGRDRGISPIFTLPLLEGSHSVYKNRGALKTGYTFRFDLMTHGNYYGEQDSVVITPTFYYIPRNGGTRQEVDLWYHEEFSGKMQYFVKIEPGGRNRDNPKSMVLGERNRNVSETEIIDTARILGLNRNTFEKAARPVGWLDKIILSQYQRTFAGKQDWLPAGVDSDTVTRSVQHWYGEYYLPNDLFAAPKGFDVAEYGRTHNGLNGKESFWLKDGYIIVNFRIETIRNGDFANPILSYGDAVWCNMFEREGFALSKTDSNGITFTLQDGDMVFYDTDKRSSDDFRTGGTH